MSNGKQDKERGFVLITTLLMLSVLVALMGAYAVASNIELATTRFSRQSTTGFYTAEAGLNVRAEAIRAIFVGYNRPIGTSPTEPNACTGTNNGAGDFACQSMTFNKRTARSYVVEDAGNPVVLTIPAGERYQYLNAQEYRFTAKATSVNSSNKDEALLELRFKSRLVPLFQFAAFYNKDLEILPGPTMTLSGPVHTNGDLYLNTNAAAPGLQITGQVTTAGDLYRGRKNDATCMSNPVGVKDPLAFQNIYPSCSSRTLVSRSYLTPWNNQVQIKVSPVTVPQPEVLDPTPGQVYWDKADLRLVLRLTGSDTIDTTNAATGIEVRNSNNTVNSAATTSLNSSATCPGMLSGSRVVSTTDPTSNTNAFYNSREAKRMRLLDVDLTGLLNCLKTTNWFSSGKLLSDSTDGGLVFHLSLSGPQSNNAANNYGVRIRNADELRSTASGAPAIRGLTIVTNQAAYTFGHFNRVNKKPAAVLSDSFNVLSTAWLDSNSWYAGASPAPGPKPLTARIATDTTVYCAVLSGTDTTGNIEGTGGQNGAYNGGLENYPRFHEDWSGRTFTYTGSWVSLNRPRHVNGTWAVQSYAAPNRTWAYDTSFNNASNLPPITPRFVYLRQELFVRDYNQN